MSDEQHSEGGRDRTERREHDRKARAYNETTGNPLHLSSTTRVIGVLIVVVVIVGVTALFVGGIIHW